MGRLAPRDIEERFTNFGASGAIVFALLARLLLAVLFRGTRPRAHVSQDKTNRGGVRGAAIPRHAKLRR